jgi:hypothetical protein
MSPSPSQSPSPSPSHSSISSISSLCNEDQQSANQIALKAQTNNSNSSSTLTLQQQPYLVKYYPDTFQSNYDDYDYQKNNNLYPYIEIFENCFCPPIIPALNGNNYYHNHHPQIYVYTCSNNNKMYSTSNICSQSTMVQQQNSVYIKN